MPKNIILCSDGTGNADIKGRGTNVFKLFEAVDLNEHRTNPELEAQLAFYDDGVGSKGSMLTRLMGNATGYGLAANVKQLYRELSRVYDEEDRIFLFGFSRGAFTVRTLADMIGKCGVLKGDTFETATDLRKAVDAAYDAYRAYYDSHLTSLMVRLTNGADGPTRVREFQENYEPYRDVKIRFIGVWDTVDAVGLPFAIADTVNTLIYQFKFPDRLLGEHVQHAYHALSLDDDRRAFEPVLWHAGEGDTRIEQVWFAGVHSNVGGGYPKQGMSLVALDWMLAHAETHRLRLQPLDNQMFRGHASVDDMMYNPRAGLGLFYRWAPRDVRAYCEKSGIDQPTIHLTVAERIAHGTDDYAPGNIPPRATVAFTPPSGQDAEDVRERKVDILQRRAAAVQEVLDRAHQERGYALDAVKDVVEFGDLSYWLFIVGWICLAGLAVALGADAIRHRHVDWHWWILWPLGGALLALALASGLSRLVDNILSDKFSTFWHPYQPQLRKALKQAHAVARAEARGEVPPPPLVTQS
ncbi:MAG: DUF2235 domain-containing protein [Acidobacteriia bacterium]|nr:DUF2235 domain-containing protein [Terriglobia bacterium]